MVLQASGRKECKCPSAEHAYIFPKGWPGNFPLQEILSLPCHPTPASPHSPSQVTITACLQHMTAVTFLACFTPQRCHPAIKRMKTVGAKRTQHVESQYLNSRLFGAGDTFMPEISLTQWGNLIYLSRSTFALSFCLSSPSPQFSSFCRCLPKSPETLVPFLHTSISCGQAVHTDTPTILISHSS